MNEILQELRWKQLCLFVSSLEHFEQCSVPKHDVAPSLFQFVLIFLRLVVLLAVFDQLYPYC